MAVDTIIEAPAVDAKHIVSSGVLVRMVTNKVGKHGRSRILAAEAAVTHKADIDSLITSVRKFKKEDTAKIDSIAASAHNDIFYPMTDPWDDSGYRYCPTALYPRMRAEIDKKEGLMMAAVDEMLENYDHMLSRYERSVGAVLAKEVPFPSQEEIRDSFGLTLYKIALRDPADWRLNNVSPEVMEEMRTEAISQMADKVEDISYHLADKLATLTSKVVVQLSKPDGKIYESLIGNIAEFVEIADALNIGKNPNISNFISRARTGLASRSVDQLKAKKGDQVLRQETLKVASDLHNDLKRFGL